QTVHIQHSVDTTELIEAREFAEQSNRAKGIFLANMSHEVRTPMNAILGISEIQLRNQNHSPEAVEAFEKICDSGTLLLNIINDILDFSKIEAGKLEISNEIYDIPSLIHDTIQINRLRFESKTIKFRLQVDPDTPLELWGDGLRLRQILNNLLSNAFKYTEKGEVVLSASFEKIPEGELDTRVIFVVRDTGQGMNEDQLARLFEEYSRFNMTMNRSVDGTGLGMSITKGLIDLMGGEITVTSTPGKGTEFVVSVPQKKFGDTICGAEITERLQNFNFRGMSISKRAQIIYEHMPYGNVLVVDDIESNLHVAAGMMTPYGLQIELVKSGRDAIEKIKQKIETKTKYDIIFMDHMMPDMNGIEAVKIIREMGYESPIVALTANAVSGQAEMFLSNGFDGFISKPIDSRELNLCLIEYVRDKYPQEIIDAARINTGKIQAAPINKTDILKFFISDAENTMKVIEETLAQIRDGTEPDNAEKFVVAAHGLKSALANIGETRLSDIALELEQAGDARDFSLISKTAPRFLDALQTLVARHKPAQKIFAEISDDEKNFLREKLSELTTACRKFNKSAIRTTFAEINEKNWPQNISAALDEISKLILHSKFEKAAALAEKTAKEM
ncbi:MAG: ATP-binding protein, partial [Defluviitaleaceae bacterium]|nr:ATP-binding protein [Defluviitaleaceae bacterium]